MGNSIFDWEDEEEIRESEPSVEAKVQAYYFHEPEPPVKAVEQTDNSWNDEPWNDPWQEAAPEQQNWDTPVEYVDYQTQNADETARRGGLAWSAGIVFFSSVAFMLLFGWVVDYLLQVSPWGIVGGIILGSIIGFIQFFRISSQIFNPAKNESAMRPLMPRDDEDA